MVAGLFATGSQFLRVEKKVIKQLLEQLGNSNTPDVRQYYGT